MENLFLDIDRASPVFQLLFSFVADEVCDEEELFSYEEVLGEILQGVSLPPEADQRLRDLFDQTKKDTPSLEALAHEIAGNFSSDRLALVALLAILLRLSVHDGIVCRRSESRLERILPHFDFEYEELKQLPEEIFTVLEFMASRSSGLGIPKAPRPELAEYYAVLGVSQESSEADIRKAYRTLVKQFHPDSFAAGSSTAKDASSSREKFEAVHGAFEAIAKARNF